MSDENITDKRFSPEMAKAIADDLFADAFTSPHNLRSNEYKSGFRAAAFNSLLDTKHSKLFIKPTDPAGSCQRDAWLSGYEEGKIAVCSFQIHLLESQETEDTLNIEDFKNSSSESDVKFSFN